MCSGFAAAGAFSMPGSSQKTTSPITQRMITGITVQISSSRVWPCTCAPSAVRGRPRPRYFQMKTTSSVSTRMKIAPVKPRMTKYAVRVFSAFGEAGVDRGEAAVARDRSAGRHECGNACEDDNEKELPAQPSGILWG